jgi:hypothetical protein
VIVFIYYEGSTRKLSINVKKIAGSYRAKGKGRVGFDPGAPPAYLFLHSW